MTAQPKKAKRWRPTFSLSKMVIMVSLVCCYVACWGPTKTRGVFDVHYHVGPSWLTEPSVSLPLVIRIVRGSSHRDYYFWFFGYVAKLPYEREIDL